jgi:hypothetical protein
MMHLKQIFSKKYSKNHTNKTELQNLEVILNMIDACRSKLTNQLTLEESEHPLFTQLIANIACVYPDCFPTPSLMAQESLKKTTEEIKRQFPRLITAVDTFTKEFFDAIHGTNENSNRKALKKT